MCIISLDIGTSGMLAVIYGLDGKKIESSYYEYHSAYPQPGYVEQDPQIWKDAAISCLSTVAQRLEDLKEEPLAISVTSQRSSLIPMKEGAPMRTAIMWQDKRTIPQCEALIAEHTLEGLYRKTGLRTNPYFVLPKILWLRENQAEIYEQAEKFIGVQDLVVHFLTGEYKTDFSQGCRTLLMNIEKFGWDEELLKVAGIDDSRLCELLPPGSVAGGLTASMAQALGLKEGLPVIMAGGDQQNAAVALGVHKPGSAEANTGTGSFVISAVDEPVFDKEARVLCQASAVAGKWIMEAGIFNTGAVYRWFKEQFCRDMSAREVYKLMDEEAIKSGMGANGAVMIPHFEGSAAPYWNPLAKGVFFNLSLNTKRGDIIRAIMEGIAAEINANISLIEEITQPIYRVSVAGGMASADVFCSIQANIYNKVVARYSNSEASSLGAAMIAAVSLGVYPNIDEAFLAMAEDTPATFYPEPAGVEKGKKLMQRKEKLYSALEKEHVYEAFMGK